MTLYWLALEEIKLQILKTRAVCNRPTPYFLIQTILIHTNFEINNFAALRQCISITQKILKYLPFFCYQWRKLHTRSCEHQPLMKPLHYTCQWVFYDVPRLFINLWTSNFSSTTKIQCRKTCKFLLPKIFSLEKNPPNPKIRDNPHGHQ